MSHLEYEKAGRCDGGGIFAQAISPLTAPTRVASAEREALLPEG